MIFKKDDKEISKDFVVHGNNEVIITLRDLSLIFTALDHYRRVCEDFSLIDRNIDRIDDYYTIRRDICELCDKLHGF